MLTLFLHLTLTHVTGGYNDDDRSADILEYRDGEGWRDVGEMKSARALHATSVVAFDQIKNKCK